MLTADSVTIPNGPLWAQEPGSVTRWMAVPWQTDTASCRSGYTAAYDPYVPTFWPARVPNQVLTRENYDIVVDESRTPEERAAAFANRAAWIEPLGADSYTSQINNMVRSFDHLGVVEVLPGPADGAFPAHLEVEDEHRLIVAEAGDDAAAIEARTGTTPASPAGPALSSVGASHRRRAVGRGRRPVGDREGAPLPRRPAQLRWQGWTGSRWTSPSSVAAPPERPWRPRWRRAIGSCSSTGRRTDVPAQGLGETLPGAAARLLRELGVWDAFVAQGHPACHARLSRWGGPQLLAQDALRDLDGAGWSLDRAAFDGLLRRRPRAAEPGC